MSITWHDLREQGRLAFGGQTPGRNLEADLVERFEQHPGDMQAAVVKLGAKFAAGKVHTPWPLVLKELEQGGTVHVLADTSADVDRQARLAEAWVRNAGLYEPTEESLLAALFDPGGRLHPWTADEALRARMVACWEREAPRGLRADREKLGRAERWKAANQTLIEEDAWQQPQPEPSPALA